jgi:Flp pilus assembly protein TadG
MLSDGVSVRASDSKFIRRATAVTLITTILAGAFIIDGAFEQFYFYSNWIRLQTAADAGATAGSHYLPKNPAQALATARAYAQLNGVRPDEIVSAAVSSDDGAITLDLRRGVPFYLTGIALGLVDRWIKAEGNAHAVHPAPRERGLQVMIGGLLDGA